jgi:outer membrane immunogenic protein
MNVTVRTLTLTAALAAVSAPALAADMYRAPAPASYKDLPYVSMDWSGFYAGVNGGYSFDSQNHPLIKDEGGFGGGQIGYNWQGALGSRSLVLGIEADFQGAGIDHSTAITFSGSGDAGTHRRAIDEFGTVRGRLGYAMGPALVYFTGGFAYGNKTNEFTDNVTGAVFKDDGWKAGYVLGGGAEYKVSPSWSVKAEYQFIGLGHNDAADAAGNTVRTVDTELSTVRAGVNYHFGSSYAPLK